MTKINKNIILNIIGVFFLILGIIAVFNTLYLGNPNQVIWFCYIILLLIGIGIFKRDAFLISVQMSIVAIPLILWNIDFIFLLLRGKSLLGITDYFLIPGPLLGKLITLQHLFTVPLAFYAISMIKLKRTDLWKVAFLEIIAVFIASRFIMPEESNVNCVYRNCLNIPINNPVFYVTFWFVTLFTLVLLTTFIISKMRFFR